MGRKLAMLWNRLADSLVTASARIIIIIVIIIIIIIIIIINEKINVAFSPKNCKGM